MTSSDDAGQRAAILMAGNALRQGLLAVVVTDTVYGLAAHPGVPGALDRIFEAKHRDRSKQVPILVSGIEAAVSRGAVFGRAGEALAARFWPGALTIVVPVGGGRDEGFRMPAHPVTQALLEDVGGALYATSANVSGEAPAGSAAEAARRLAPHVAAVVDGAPEPSGIASTVVKVTRDTVVVLREGAVSRLDIESCVRSA